MSTHSGMRPIEDRAAKEGQEYAREIHHVMRMSLLIILSGSVP